MQASETRKLVTYNNNKQSDTTLNFFFYTKVAHTLLLSFVLFVQHKVEGVPISLNSAYKAD